MLNALAPYMNIIKAVILFVIFSFGVGVGIHHEQPRIDRLNQTIGKQHEALMSMGAAIKEQNGAFAKLQSDEKQRQEKAKIAINNARVAVANANAAAKKILDKSPPKGNICDAASAEFDKELKLERGIK